MLTVLIIRGATLSGSVEGIKFYMGTVNFSVLKNPSVPCVRARKEEIISKEDFFRFGKMHVHKYFMH